MKEILLLFTCVINNKGDICSTTYNAYYEDNIQLRQSLNYVKDRAEQKVPKVAATYAIPAVLLATGASTTVKLNRYFNLKHGSSENSLVFVYSF